MDEKYYNPQAIYSPQSMEDYENQMRLENGYAQRYKDNFGVNNDIGYNMPNNYGSTAQANLYGMGSRTGATMAEILDKLFGDAEASPAPTPQEGERHPKGFGRPMAMTYDEYERQYMPYQYAERARNNMHNNYDNYTQGINLDEYLDQLE